jgi:hypothetical protein
MPAVLSCLFLPFPPGKSVTFTIHASKIGANVRTERPGPTLAVDKARLMMAAGWMTHIVDPDGRVYEPERYDQLLSLEQRH